MRNANRSKQTTVRISIFLRITRTENKFIYLNKEAKKMKTFFTITYLLLSVWSFGQWTPLNVSMNNNFIDVQFVNDSVGFISGSGGALLKTTDL